MSAYRDKQVPAMGDGSFKTDHQVWLGYLCLKGSREGKSIVAILSVIHRKTALAATICLHSVLKLVGVQTLPWLAIMRVFL